MTMKNFGNWIRHFFPIAFFIFLFRPVYAADIEFNLSANTLPLGEVVFLDVRYEGNGEIKPIEKRYDSGAVQVYYIGDSYETQIINFKVSKRHILKYQITSNQLGKQRVPRIKISINNQVVESQDLWIEVVKKEPKNNQQTPSNIFDQFFGDSNNESEEGKPPEVVFHTSRNVCYLGEPIVGYYVLYFNGLKQPFLERDPNQSIAFPFFLSETLSQVTVQIDPTAIRNGNLRHTLVYLKEIYGLTPMQVGQFELGSTNFIVGDSMKFGVTSDVIPVQKGSVKVLPLPPGAPKNFKGAIGDYEISLEKSQTKVHLGETLYFSVRVFGSGAGIGLEDPLQIQTSAFKKELFLLKKEKSKVFRKLPEGEFGFYSVVEFFYSFQSKKEGTIELPSPSVTYFSPKLGTYQTKFLPTIPISILPKRILNSSNRIEAKDNSEISGNYFFWILFGVLSGTLIFWAAKSISDRRISKIKLQTLNEKFGSKKGDILGDYLVRHGVTKENAKVLSELSLAFPNQNWENIYQYCNKEDKRLLIHITNNLKNQRSKI